MAQVFAARGASALVVRGDDGLDELTTATTSTVRRVRAGTVTEHVLDPHRLGLATSPSSALRGGDAGFNAEVVRRMLAGEPGPVRDAVVLNAAAALVALADAAGSASDDLDEAMGIGLTTAAQAVDSGAAARTLERWVEASEALAEPTG